MGLRVVLVLRESVDAQEPLDLIVNYSDPIIYYGDSLVTSSFLKPAQYHEVKQGDYFKFISELKVTKPLSVVIVEC